VNSGAFAACAVSGVFFATSIGWLLRDFAKAKRNGSNALSAETRAALRTMSAVGRIGAAFWDAQQEMRREATLHYGESRGQR